MRCLACDYDLSRTVDAGLDVCPECGVKIDRARLELGELWKQKYAPNAEVFVRSSLSPVFLAILIVVFGLVAAAGTGVFFLIPITLLFALIAQIRMIVIVENTEVQIGGKFDPPLQLRERWLMLFQLSNMILVASLVVALLTSLSLWQRLGY